MTSDLDTRARAASDAVHRAVRDLPADRMPGGSRAPRGRLVLVAAAVLVAVALGAALLRQGDDDTRVATDGDGDLPRLVLGEVPDGLAATGAVDLPLPGPAPEGWVYGDRSSPQPFAEADLAVMRLDAEYAAQVQRAGPPPIELGGHPAWWSPGEGSAPSVLTVDVGDGLIVLASWTFDRSTLEAAADELDLDSLSDPPATVAGLDLVGHGTAGLTPSPVIPAGGRGHLIGYQGGVENDRTLSVATIDGTDDDLALLRWTIGPEAKAVEVDGHQGWVGSPFGVGTSAVIWEHADGVLVMISGSSVDLDELLQAAGSLREASEEEWSALLAETESLVPGDAAAGVSVDGVEGDSDSFAAYLDADGSLCLANETLDGSEATCSGLTGAAVDVSTVRFRSGRVLLAVYTTLGVPGLVDIEIDGEPIAGVVSATTEHGTLLTVSLPSDTTGTRLEVVDREGTVLGSTSFGAPPDEPGSFSGSGTEIPAPAG